MADVLLDRPVTENAAPAAPSPAGVPGAVDLGGLASRAFVTGPAKIASMIDAKGAAQQPAIDATRSALASPPPSDAGVVAAERRIHDVAAQQPSKGLRAFLAPVDGEDPLASINKLVQAVGLFAGGLGIRGSAHGAAKGSVAALTGAIAGWNAGDKERADRAFKDWQAKSNEALKGWEVESAAYQRALTTRGLTLQERMDMIRLAAMEHDNPIAAEQVRAQGVMGFVDYLTKREDVAAKMAESRARLIQSHEEKEKDRELRREIAEQNAQLRLDLAHERAAEKRETEKQKRTELEEQYSGPALRMAAIDYATTGKLPPNIARGSSGQFLIPKIYNDAIAWAKENGIDPNSFQTLRGEVDSAKKALTKLRGVNAIQEASIRRFEGHVDKLLELSDKVDRSERPVLARYQLKSRGEYGGDPEVAAYQAQAFEVAMEFSRVVVGTAQGDHSTREEARKAIDGALNKEQLRSVVETLRGNAKRNLERNKESEQAASSIIDAATGGKPKSGGAKGKMVIRRKSDGKEFEGDEGPVPDGYERAR